MRIIECAINLVARLLTSLAIPAWGLLTLGLGLRASSPWWIAAGAVITAIGAVVLIGSPLVRPFWYDA